MTDSQEVNEMPIDIYILLLLLDIISTMHIFLNRCKAVGVVVAYRRIWHGETLV